MPGSKIPPKTSEESCFYFLLPDSMPGSKIPPKTSEESYFLLRTSYFQDGTRTRAYQISPLQVKTPPYPSLQECLARELAETPVLFSSLPCPLLHFPFAARSKSVKHGAVIHLNPVPNPKFGYTMPKVWVHYTQSLGTILFWLS